MKFLDFIKNIKNGTKKKKREIILRRITEKERPEYKRYDVNIYYCRDFQRSEVDSGGYNRFRLWLLESSKFNIIEPEAITRFLSWRLKYPDTPTIILFPTIEGAKKYFEHLNKTEIADKTLLFEDLKELRRKGWRCENPKLLEQKVKWGIDFITLCKKFCPNFEKCDFFRYQTLFKRFCENGYCIIGETDLLLSIDRIPFDSVILSSEKIGLLTCFVEAQWIENFSKNWREFIESYYDEVGDYRYVIESFKAVIASCLRLLLDKWKGKARYSLSFYLREEMMPIGDRERDKLELFLNRAEKLWRNFKLNKFDEIKSIDDLYSVNFCDIYFLIRKIIDMYKIGEWNRTDETFKAYMRGYKAQLRFPKIELYYKVGKNYLTLEEKDRISTESLM